MEMLQISIMINGNTNRTQRSRIIIVNKSIPNGDDVIISHSSRESGTSPFEGT
ncbi:hypothetical protein DPMN_126485 [Dreissena polymorpha]|uniref:Uncharacterized protein n=1 Tax=Dreissena polymorpha TaxID=45954 RepID=A0A9D4JY02_DREPO|nr:hypothetical protein DPMN_126485 [Dreissena polymorpha]